MTINAASPAAPQVNFLACAIRNCTKKSLRTLPLGQNVVAGITVPLMTPTIENVR